MFSLDASKNKIKPTLPLLINTLTIYNNKVIPITEKKYDNFVHNNIAFITLTNTGYIDYTLNCLKSLENICMKTPLKSYCIGEEGYNILKNKNVLCEFIHDNDPEASKFQEFKNTNWNNIMYYKFKLIYNNLLNHEYVCITDGDIVYENNTLFHYLLDNIDDNELLIQSEGLDVKNIDTLCAGFMFIKSNKNTLALFNPENVLYTTDKIWDDQIYVNSIKNKLKYKILPLPLFPNGKYYYHYNATIKPYLIHFNWVVGNKKQKMMIQYNKWYK